MPLQISSEDVLIKASLTDTALELSANQNATVKASREKASIITLLNDL